MEPQVHHEKENVIDQIKRGPLGKFFNKKKEVEHKEEVPATVETTEEPTVAAAVVEEEPVASAGKFRKCTCEFYYSVIKLIFFFFNS